MGRARARDAKIGGTVVATIGVVTLRHFLLAQLEGVLEIHAQVVPTALGAG